MKWGKGKKYSEKQVDLHLPYCDNNLNLRTNINVQKIIPNFSIKTVHKDK